MKKLLVMFLAMLMSVSLVGCASKQEQGAVTGMAVGAVLGSALGRGHHDRPFAIWLGAVVGSMLGSTIGRYMDEQDAMRTSMALENNRTHESTTWVNPDTQYQYTVEPTRTYEMAEGTPCREFTMNAIIGGKTEEIYGTACRQQDGSWKIIK
ncbi:MAG: RT0821/Lpp0805 family surface protein [Thioalkalispiraceae bacterium]|jgi:surface antigen